MNIKIIDIKYIARIESVLQVCFDTLVEDHNRIKEIFPAAVFVTIPGAGHWVHADKPNEVLEVLEKFIPTGNVDS
ncbi:hypothetical protein L9F63_006929 [Diploptera punctata]|uniref:Uncharacterized protein n=1 Tax=Diploptera punctata TaxID=6984 RepID=A0AAD7Z9F0_DIPPU|nr:hypothetical protein L9F63_006929 [Diploptera punctata]